MHGRHSFLRVASWPCQQSTCTVRTARGNRPTGQREPGQLSPWQDSQPHPQGPLGASHHLSEGLALRPACQSHIPGCAQRDGAVDWLALGCRLHKAIGSNARTHSARPRKQTHVHQKLGPVVLTWTLVFPCASPNPPIFMSSMMVIFCNFKQLREDVARKSCCLTSHCCECPWPKTLFV